MYDETSRCEEDEEVAMLGGEGRGSEGRNGTEHQPSNNKNIAATMLL